MCTYTVKKNKPDLSFIQNTIKKIYKYLKIKQLIILESTSYPGTTRELVVEKLNKKFDVGKDFFIGFSSERINPGENENVIDEIPKVISGYSDKCLNLIVNFIQKFLKKL